MRRRQAAAEIEHGAEEIERQRPYASDVGHATAK
jgi:hypothetical protein